MQMVWSPDVGLLELRFGPPDLRATREDAIALLKQVDHWTRGRSQGYGFLVDCAQVVDADPAWRAELNRYFRRGEVPVTVAWYNATVLIRVMVEMFVLVTPSLEGKVFKREAAARAYLREKGFG